MALIKRHALWWAVAGGVITAIVILGAWQGVHYTSSTEFCLSCHSMNTAGKEYQQSIHFKNASGVRAECRDCHIPPGAIPMLVRKTQALNDLYRTFISPSIDTPEKFAEKRAELAQREWKRMSDSASATCKSCHRYEAMDHARQSPNAAAQMTAAAAQNSNCIDCHKGIAHRMPDMSSGFRDEFKRLVRQSAPPVVGKTLFTLTEKSIYAGPDGAKGRAMLMPATEVRVLSREGDNVRVEIVGWRESAGRGRVITQYPGKRVFSAVLDESLMQGVKVLKTQVDPDSHQEWQQISVPVWSRGDGFISDIRPVWQYAGQMLQNTCSACHGVPATTRYSANGWIAGLKAMSTYYRLSNEEERILLKYLQTHASDVPQTENNK